MLEFLVTTAGAATTPLVHAQTPIDIFDNLRAEVATMTVADLKRSAAKAGIDVTSFLEKEEFVHALANSRRCDEIYWR